MSTTNVLLALLLATSIASAVFSNSTSKDNTIQTDTPVVCPYVDTIRKFKFQAIQDVLNEHNLTRDRIVFATADGKIICFR